MSILVFGEPLVDVFQSGRTVLGGAPFNTARAAARLGAPTLLATTLATDSYGEQLSEALCAAGVDTRYVSRSALPTAQVRVHGEPPTYDFALENTASLEFPITPITTAPVVYYGSIAALRDPFAAPLRAYLSLSRSMHFFDPNVRLGALPPEFPLAKRVHDLASFADVIRLSEEDLSALPADAPQQWLTGRTKVVIITRGSRPATVYFAGGGVFHVPVVPAPNFIDSVGAGDTVNGAILASLQRLEAVPKSEASWRAVLDTAFAAAALTCSRIGAHPPTRAELTQFTKRLASSQ